MSSGIITGNLQSMGVVAVTLSPAEVAANTSAEQTFTLPGLKSGDVIVGVSKPTTQAGLGIVGWRVSAANTVAITFMNATGSPITPTASQTYLITWARRDAVQSGIAP
jgi:hypothetical protein